MTRCVFNCATSCTYPRPPRQGCRCHARVPTLSPLDKGGYVRGQRGYIGIGRAKMLPVGPCVVATGALSITQSTSRGGRGGSVRGTRGNSR